MAQEIMSEAMARAGTPGMAVAIVAPEMHQAPVFVSQGWADREAQRPVTADTLFMTGSISKLVTATLVMQLVEEGKLDLDARVNDFLPAARRVRSATGAPAPVTVRQLLTHTSGLPPSWAGASPSSRPAGSMDAQLESGLTLKHAPGSRTVYTNLGFVLLGDLVARLDGRPFEACARHRVLHPLGMKRSSFASVRSWDPLNGDLAAPYGDMLGGTERSAYLDVTAIAPASGLISSAAELASLARLWMEDRRTDSFAVLSPASVEAMTALSHVTDPELEEGFGLGFGVRRHGGRHIAWWDGALVGAAARLALLVEHRIGVVVLSNHTANDASASVAGRILDALVAPEPVAYLPSVTSLQSAAGTYRMLDFLDPDAWYLSPLATVTVRARRGSLELTSWVTQTTRLVPEGPNRYRVRGSAADGAAVRISPGELQAGFVRAEKLSWWRGGWMRLWAFVFFCLARVGRALQHGLSKLKGAASQLAHTGHASGPRWWEALPLLPRLARDPLRLTEVLTRRYGGVVRLPAPGRTFVLVTEPAEVERILVRSRDKFAKNREFVGLASLLLGSSLLTSENETWRRHQRRLRQLFQGSMQRRFDEIAIASTEDMLTRWRKHEGTVDVGRDTHGLAFQIAGRWLGGAELTAQAEEVRRSLDICQEFFLRRLGVSVLWGSAVASRVPRRVRRAIERVRAITGAIVKQRRRLPATNDALSWLMHGWGEHSLGDEELIDHAITILVAGHETSGVAFAWMLDLLARHPEVVHRLRDELEARLGDRPLKSADLPHLRYARQVAYEVVRLYPSLPLIGRDVVEPLRLGDVFAPAGSTVIMSSWAMQRRDDLWGTPQDFDPDRFAEGLPKGPRRFAYVPFGAGPRTCVGARMTIHQLMIVATLCARRLDLHASAPPPFARVRATLQPHRPLRLSVRAR